MIVVPAYLFYNGLFHDVGLFCFASRCFVMAALFFNNCVRNCFFSCSPCGCTEVIFMSIILRHLYQHFYTIFYHIVSYSVQDVLHWRTPKGGIPGQHVHCLQHWQHSFYILIKTIKIAYSKKCILICSMFIIEMAAMRVAPPVCSIGCTGVESLCDCAPIYLSTMFMNIILYHLHHYFYIISFYIVS